jgi:glycerol-3-phosphate dehydrogenase
MRGVRTALVEQHDFAFGTSSRSSRLLHGGLRYLEQGRVGLVHEASVEKKTVHRIAPHLGTPLGFVFPSFKGDRPLWQLRIGVKIYDLLCGGRNFQPSRGFNRKETLAMLPALRADNLNGSVRYFDALTSDARLVYDTLTSAQRAGAVVGNYLRFEDCRREDGLWVCSLTDKLSGSAFTVRARTIVNAAGPWAESLRHSSVKLRLSKGIHIVIDRKRLPVPSAVVITEGKRLLFVLPWGERVIIGTTDTDYQGAPEKVAVAAEDVAYVLHTVNDFFPSIRLAERDIISSWAGLRPLIANPDGTPSDVSRAHQIRTPEPGWWDIAGGKLTTYRLMSEQAVDQIVRHLDRPVAPCRTAVEPLLPTDVENRFSGIVPPACTREAVEHYMTQEWAVHLDDVLVRRSSWHYYETTDVSEQVANWMAEIAGWSATRKAEEIAAYRAAVGWTPSTTRSAA